jgi:hypothetical protein
MAFVNIASVYNKAGFVIDFFHLATGKGVSFDAFIPAGGFKDSYESNWKAEEVFGRMDALQNFVNTKRSISLSWDVPSVDFEDAKSNQAKAERLLKMLYPVYEPFDAEGSLATRMRASPLFRVKFANLISQTSSEGGKGDKGPKKNGDWEGKLAANSGLVAKLSGLSYEPDLESGIFEDFAGVSLYPQTIKFSCTIDILHDHTVGWKKTGEFYQPKFPYSGKGDIVEEDDTAVASADDDPDSISGISGQGVLA